MVWHLSLTSAAFGAARLGIAIGAGEKIAHQVEQGAKLPTTITLLIAAILALWSLYAFSGAGVIPRLPLLNTGLIIITAIYLLRAAALPLMMKNMPIAAAAFS